MLLRGGEDQTVTWFSLPEPIWLLRRRALLWKRAIVAGAIVAGINALALLASAPDLTTFTILRVTQGLCMASAFTLTLTYLGEECSATDAGGAFAAYITGNVASNLIGRLISAGVADHFGLAANFYFFSALNLAPASAPSPGPPTKPPSSPATTSRRLQTALSADRFHRSHWRSVRRGISTPGCPAVSDACPFSSRACPQTAPA